MIINFLKGLVRFPKLERKSRNQSQYQNIIMKEIDINVNWQSQRVFVEQDIIYMERLFKLRHSLEDSAIRVFDATGYDGFAAGKGSLFMATVDGRVSCYSERQQ